MPLGDVRIFALEGGYFRKARCVEWGTGPHLPLCLHS